MTLQLDHIECADALTYLRSLPDECVNCIVTSPPYLGLRDYGMPGQIGLEPTPAEYVAALVTVFREAKRVLRSDGVLWLNLGDSYGSGEIGRHDSVQGREIDGKRVTSKATERQQSNRPTNLPPKSLIGIPWRVAFALQDDGWILRSDIIWAKNNPMPESVTDRPTKAHEYIFLFSKAPRYWYDAQAVAEPIKAPLRSIDWETRVMHGATGGAMDRGSNQQHGKGVSHDLGGWDGTRNRRSVWTINPASFKGAHFATFPEEIPEICIKAGCPEGGVVLDPFTGAGTTALVAKRLNRRYIGSELNPAYVEMARARIDSIPYTLFSLMEVGD